MFNICFSFRVTVPNFISASQHPLNCLTRLVELFRIQIKTQTFLYFFLLQKILKCFWFSPALWLLEFEIWSCQKLSQRFFCFIYIVFNQNYIITHKHGLVFKAQHIIMHILFAKLIKETILYNPLPPPTPSKNKNCIHFQNQLLIKSQ